jgi:phosphate starvation-inducible PhoH-like protein
MEIDEDSSVPLPSAVNAAVFTGPGDRNLKFIQELFQADLVIRDGNVRVIRCGRRREAILPFLQECVDLLSSRGRLGLNDLKIIRDNLLENGEPRRPRLSTFLQTPRITVQSRSLGQERLYRAAQENDIVFVIGPAGTGKTFLAVALALQRLLDHRVDRVVLSRPAVEAGESLGFLPGDLRNKVDPYLRPLYDSLFDMLERDKVKRLLETEVLEVGPLAYMRGRTLNHSCMILDEAQNATPNQLKMFLTRLGANSSAIITGDITQVDLPAGVPSGLREVQHIVREVPGVAFVYLDQRDVTRHPVVRDIIQAYETHDRNNGKGEP